MDLFGGVAVGNVIVPSIEHHQPRLVLANQFSEVVASNRAISEPPKPRLSRSILGKDSSQIPQANAGTADTDHTPWLSWNALSSAAKKASISDCQRVGFAGPFRAEMSGKNLR